MSKTYGNHWKVIYYDDKNRGWTKGAPKHIVKWWWNDDVDLAVKQKRGLRNECKKGGCKEAYRLGKKDSIKAVYGTKKTVEKERFRDILDNKDNRKKVVTITNQVKLENCDVVGYKCFKNNNRDLAVSDSEKAFC